MSQRRLLRDRVQTLSLSARARHDGTSVAVVHRRLQAGGTVADALETPVQPHSRLPEAVAAYLAREEAAHRASG
jgi:hypothetical protein